MKSQASNQNRKSKASQMVHSKVKPVVVKHVLAQNYIQQPDVYQRRPQQKQLSVQSGGNYANSQFSNSMSKNTYQQVQQMSGMGAHSTAAYSAAHQLQAQLDSMGAPMGRVDLNVGHPQLSQVSGTQGLPMASMGQYPSMMGGFDLGHLQQQQSQQSQQQLQQQLRNGLMQQNVSEGIGAGLQAMQTQQQPNVPPIALLQKNASQSKNSIGYSELSQSPRFYKPAPGMTIQNGISQPDQVCRDLIQNLHSGMQGLQKFAARENVDPNTQMIKTIDATTGVARLEHKMVGNNFDAQSIKSDITYKWSAIGEMGNEELDQLKVKNEGRMKEIEDKYFAANKQILTAKEIMRDAQDKFETKERFKDASINYPTYGRGLKLPGIELNTFMVQEGMCADPAAKKKRQASGSGSPKADVQAQQRKRILSPRRQRFETKFEKFITKKNVDDLLEDQPAPEFDFDTTTKPEGTQNAKVNQKLQWEKEEKIREKESQLLKSLPTLEKDAQEVLQQEQIVIIGKEMLDKLNEVFESCKERGKEHLPDVETPELIASIAEDPYFEKCMATVVRENVDGVKETLENLLHRVLKTYKQPTIEWSTFLGFFTKRGRLRESEKLNLQLNKKAGNMGGLDDMSQMSGQEQEEDFEMKQYRLTKELQRKLVHKQNLVPKTGKGKYNVTVPVPFEFLNAEKGFSIRQRKVEQMVNEKRREEERALSVEYKAREVPKNVKQNKFEKLMREQEQRRADAKRFAMAKIKASEAPFAFYERDIKAQKEKYEQAELPPSVPDNAPFRAGKIPWRILVPLYKTMVDANENERDKRVKRNAELSLSLSKLPPRMEASEKQRKEKEQLQENAQQASAFSFKPPVPKAVPDFKRIHKEFNYKLERNKSAAKLTVPQPFQFHEPKNKADLRKHMDAENQIINPTKKKRARSYILNQDLADIQKINPSTTKKHEAMVAMRRQHQTHKLAEKAEVHGEDQIRAIKQLRLTNRVKQSPALANNALELKKKRTNGLQRARDQMKYLENVYNQQKAIMEFNVANRPLLVEQQTQEFINLYNQIRDLQKYVAILRNANYNPNEHLTEDQKILLQRAQYFDQLNQLAYFPGGIPAAAGDEGGVNVLDEQQQQQLLMLQQQQQPNEFMQVDQQQQDYQPGEHYERVGGEHEEQFVDQDGMDDQGDNVDLEEQQQQQRFAMQQQQAIQNQMGQYEEEDDGENDDDQDQDDGEEMEDGQAQQPFQGANHEPEIVNELHAHMEMDEGEDQEDDGEEDDDQEHGRYQQMGIDGQGDQQLMDEDGMDDEDDQMDGDGEEEDEDDQEQLQMQQHMLQQQQEGDSPANGEDELGDYGDNEDVDEADHQVQQLMAAQRQQRAQGAAEEEDEMDDDGEELEGEGEEDMYELDEEQYQQLLMQMQANQQNMLIDQQENGEMPQNLNQQQLRQVEGMQGYPQEMQDMYGDEEYEDEGEEMVGDEDIDGEMDAYGEEHMMAEEGVNRH